MEPARSIGGSEGSRNGAMLSIDSMRIYRNPPSITFFCSSAQQECGRFISIQKVVNSRSKNDNHKDD